MTKPDGSPVEVARTWLLSALDGGGWTEAEAIEAAREAAGVSARALTTARGRLVSDGRVEKRKAGRGAWSYRLVGRVPESEPAPESESEAAPDHEAEPAASPEAGGGPAVPEVPERFAATLRFLAGAPVPEDFDRMAFIQSWMWQLRNAVERDGPRLMAAPNDDPTLDCFLVKVALDTLARDCGYSLTISRLDRR